MDQKELEQDFSKTIEKLKEDLAGVRVGRANASLVENISVDYYGAKSPIKQVAQITTPDSQTIMITPWNKDDLVSIEKGINESDLNLVPNNNGESVIIKIPSVTEERRMELVKMIKRKTEDARVGIRQKREKYLGELNDQKKDKDISEDDFFNAKERMQESVDIYIKKADELGAKKEEEIKVI